MVVPATQGTPPQAPGSGAPLPQAGTGGGRGASSPAVPGGSLPGPGTGVAGKDV